MSLKVTFELEDKDLRYFRANMKQAQSTTSSLSEEEIISKAAGMVEEVKAAKIPLFVRQRVNSLTSLIDMIQDSEWDLTAQERQNVLAALAYFADPQDMIPDDIPVLGFIDDAIMIELVVTELKHEMDAFEDFCRYRKEEKARNRNPDLSRDEYLALKRRELMGRMRRRRKAHSRRQPSRTRIRLF